MLCLLILFYIGIICSIGGWSSSYAVLKNVDTKQSAVIYPAFFWGLITFGRFIIAYIPGTVNTKLKVSIQATLVIQIVSLLLKELGFVKGSLYFKIICIGITISALFPMIFAISK